MPQNKQISEDELYEIEALILAFYSHGCDTNLNMKALAVSSQSQMRHSITKLQ